MKKIVTLLLLVSLTLCTCLALTACGGGDGGEGVVSKWLRFTLNEDGNSYSVSQNGLQEYLGEVSEGAESVTSITIPPKYNGKPVTAIEKCGFQNCPYITEVVLPDSIKSIGDEAFEFCRSLQSINIPDSVVSIGFAAFRDCPFDEIEIPDSVTRLGDSAFNNCVNLTSVTIPDSVTYIGTSLFNGCTNLTEVTLPSTITELPLYIFSGCGFESYAISDKITSIGEGAFSNCTKITEISIPASVTNIGANAFSGCNGLTSVVIPDTVTSVGDGAFNSCENLRSITLGGGMSSFPKYLISGCNNLEDITIPAGITKIEEFYLNYLNNPSAFSIYYNGSVLDWANLSWSHDDLARLYFQDDNGSVSHNGKNYELLVDVVIPENTTVASNAFRNISCIESVTLSDGVSLGEYAFRHCNNLSSVTISAGVTKIEYGAFLECFKLVEVCNDSGLELFGTYADSNALNVYSSDRGASKLYLDSDGLLCYVDGDDKILISYRSAESKLTVPNGVTEIYQYALYNNSSLTSIVIPESVTKIGSYAFYGCKNVTSVSLPIGLKNSDVGMQAFYGCNVPLLDTLKFEWIESENGYSLVGYNCLFNTQKLVIPSTYKDSPVTSIGNSAFYNCDLLTSVVLPDSIKSVGITAFENCDYLAFNEHNNAYYLGTAENEFFALISAKDTAITGCTVHKDAKLLATAAFSHCSELESISLPSGLLYIDTGVFADCDKLEYNEYENGYYLGNEQNPYLLLMGVKSNDITGFTVHADTKFIGQEAFSQCNSLQSVTLGDKLTTVMYAAFWGCNGLTDIYYSGSETDWEAVRVYASNDALANATLHYNHTA